MKDCKLTITINKPVKEVWDYILDSNNIPKWITSIKKEVPSEVPTKVGTVLKSYNNIYKYNEYKVTKILVKAL